MSIRVRNLFSRGSERDASATHRIWMRRLTVLLGMIVLTLLCVEDAQAQRRGPNPRLRRDSIRAARARQDSIQQAKTDSLYRESIDSTAQARRDSVWRVLQDSAATAPKDSATLAREDSLWQSRQDSLWKDLGLDPEGYDPESDLFGKYSHGWFPQASPAQSLSLTFPVLYSNVYDAGNSIRSRSFVPTTAPFGWRNPFESNEQDILKPNSDEVADDGYPFTSYGEYGLSYTFSLPMPLILRGDARLSIVDGMIFSNDTTRSYLTLSGLKRPLKEVSVLHLEQYLLSGSVGFNIPFYGVFLEWDAMSVSSYYYLHAAASAGFAVSSKATQYMQIANVKDELRYGNGSDTVTVMEAGRLSELNRFRTAIDVGLGWNFSAAVGTFFVEAFVSAPLSTVVRDAEWREYYVGFRFGLGYQWLPE